MISIDEFNGIYRQHVDAVFRVTLRSVSRREIDEEITSEVFLAFYQNAASLSTEQLPAWLFTVAKRRAADYWRRWYLEERWSLEDANEPTTFTPEYSLEDLLAKCDSLKPIHRVCVILRFAHGMSRTEIAQQTGLSEHQVKGNLQYALKLLRDTLTTRTPNLPPHAGVIRRCLTSLPKPILPNRMRLSHPVSGHPDTVRLSPYCAPIRKTCCPPPSPLTSTITSKSVPSARCC
ncbi:MAG TPA: sigma-70 family RNA polymerase sigma factor [Edaphobacter sp.]